MLLFSFESKETDAWTQWGTLGGGRTVKDGRDGPRIGALGFCKRMSSFLVNAHGAFRG